MELKPFNCTILIFDPETETTIAEHVLPADSPDAEHAAASTLANAASFTPKMDGMTPNVRRVPVYEGLAALGSSRVSA